MANPEPMRDPADLLRVPACADASLAGNEDDLRQLNEYLVGEAKHIEARAVRFAALAIYRDALAMRLHGRGEVVATATTDKMPAAACPDEKTEEPEPAGETDSGPSPGCPCPKCRKAWHAAGGGEGEESTHA